MKKKIIIVLIVICVLGTGAYFLMGRNRAKKASSNLIMVNLQEVNPQQITTKVSADGNIRTEEEEDIKVRLNGLVEELYIEEGQKVEVGQEILKLEEETLKKALENAQLTLEEARKNYDNLKNTYNSQDGLNDLKLKEARRNLQIAVLSKDKEIINLENQKHSLQEKQKEAKRNLNNLKEELADKEHLYENDAIPKNELERTSEDYERAKKDYQNIKRELETLVEKTIPNAMELAQLKVDNAQNSLDLLKANIQRDRITKNDLEVANIKVIKARREIKNIESDLEKVVTSAPISGTVLQIKVKSGDKVTEGSTVGQIADINNLRAEVMVDEIDVNDVKEGQIVNITSDSFEKTLKGEVKTIAPISTKVGNINKYKTKIELRDTGGLLRPGMFVNAEIITKKKEDVIAVPSMAVLGEKEKYVFVAKDGKAQKRSIEVGIKSLSKVEVKGVQPEEKVVIGPFTILKDLKDGTSITGKKNGNNR